MIHAVSQNFVATETEAIKVMIHRFERSLVLHPRLKYETRRESDVKIATSMFDKQGVLHSSLNPSAWVLLSQQPQTRALYVRLAVQVQSPNSDSINSHLIRESQRRNFQKWAHQSDFKRRSRRWISSRDSETETQLGWKFHGKQRIPTRRITL